MTTTSTAATSDVRPVAVETRLAAEVKRLLASDQRARAAERFGEIVDRQQRRASRIAYHYLRDPAEVDEVVQDAFLKAFLHLPSFREDLFFELWFTRILVNACLWFRALPHQSVAGSPRFWAFLIRRPPKFGA